MIFASFKALEDAKEAKIKEKEVLKQAEKDKKKGQLLRKAADDCLEKLKDS